MSLNKCIFEGRLTRDTETQTFNSGTSKTKFGLAVDGRPYKDKVTGEKVKGDTMFIDCELWGTAGDVVSSYFKKGDVIIVEGELRLETWDDKATGSKRSKHLLRVTEFNFPLGGNKKSDSEAMPSEEPKKNGRKKKESQQQPSTPFEAEENSNDDIPF